LIFMTTPPTKGKASRSPLPSGVEVLGEITPAFSEILTPEALAFVAKLQRQFGTRRRQCLERRQERQRRLDQGEGLDFLPETKHIREGDWKCAPIPIGSPSAEAAISPCESASTKPPDSALKTRRSAGG